MTILQAKILSSQSVGELEDQTNKFLASIDPALVQSIQYSATDRYSEVCIVYKKEV